MVYEYECSKCKYRFELRRTVSQAKDVAFCPLCQSKTERIFSSFSFFSRGGNKTAPSISSSAGRCGSCATGSCATCH